MSSGRATRLHVFTPSCRRAGQHVFMSSRLHVVGPCLGLCVFMSSCLHASIAGTTNHSNGTLSALNCAPGPRTTTTMVSA
eukprot:4793359-Pyramimonas_sp.AAC.1